MPNKKEDDVRSAFDRAIEGAASPEELDATVRVLVRDLKKEGRPPESVIVTIKNLCGLSQMTVAADTGSSIDFSERKKISDMVVSTVIEEYYTGTRLAGRRPWKGYSLEIGEDPEITII
ncbi:MAG TPA: hypothetical protein VF836_04815 [Gemmatimonadaceae bacterium]